MKAAKARRVLLLAPGLLTLLAPVGLADLPRLLTGGPGERAVSAASAGGGEPNGLELNAPDLLGLALRVELGPGYASAAATLREEAPEFPGAAAFSHFEPVPARSAAVAEPPRALLLLLMLAGAWGASRETRRRSRALRRRP